MTTRGLALFGLPLALVAVVIWALLAGVDRSSTTPETGLRTPDEGEDNGFACVRTAAEASEDGPATAATLTLTGAADAVPSWPPADMAPPREPSCARAPPPRSRDRRHLTGVVVDLSGDAVPGVEVFLADRDGDRVKRLDGVPGDAITDAQGRYLLVTPTPGTYSAAARVDGYGTGWSGPVELTRPEPVEAPFLELRGDGWFSGVVVFPDGRPAEGVEVCGRVDLSRGGSWSSSRHPGLHSVDTRTDADGRFRIAGLLPGPYVVSVDDCETRPLYFLPKRGDTGLRFVLQRRALRVLLRDAQGRPLEDALLDRFDPARNACSRMNPPGAAMNFYGNGGERFFLCAHYRHCVPCVQEVSIPTDAWMWEITFVPRGLGKDKGRIALRVLDPDHELVERYDVTVRAIETGTEIRWLDEVAPDDEGMLNDVPAGTWRIDIRPRDPEGGVSHPFLFPCRTEVEVNSDLTTEVEVPCRRGGRIRITSIWPDGLDEEDVDADLDLEGPVKTPIHYLWPDPSEPGLTPRLEPGRWVIVVHGDGVKTQRFPVEIRAGQIVDAEIHVVPEDVR